MPPPPLTNMTLSSPSSRLLPALPLGARSRRRVLGVAWRSKPASGWRPAAQAPRGATGRAVVRLTQASPSRWHRDPRRRRRRLVSATREPLICFLLCLPPPPGFLSVRAPLARLKPARLSLLPPSPGGRGGRGRRGGGRGGGDDGRPSSKFGTECGEDWSRGEGKSGANLSQFPSLPFLRTWN